MKTAVIYKSKSGFVKKYAEWIAEELSADIFEASTVTPTIMGFYDTVVFGGGLYAIGINGVKLITGNMDKLEGKKVVVFASGASPFSERVLNEVRNSNFSEVQQEKIHFFYLRGGFDYNKLKSVDKILMTLLNLKIKLKEKKNKELTSDEKGMLVVHERPADYTNRKNINEIVSLIRA